MDDRNCLHFVGRISWHAKINGKRVNLREVENMLRELLKDCAVVIGGHKNQGKLYAFYTEKLDGIALGIKQHEMRESLQEYMIPTLIHIDGIPTLPNSKVNRKALQKTLENILAPFFADLEKIRQLQRTKKMKSIIEGFWREALHLSLNTPLNLSDTFEDLGGDSQAAIWLVNKINYYFNLYFGVKIKISSMTLYTQTQNTFYAFYTHIIRAYLENKLAYGHPNIPVTPIRLALMSGGSLDNYYGYYPEEGNKRSIQAAEHSYNSLELIIDYVNSYYGIFIRISDSIDKAIHLIEEFRNDVNAPRQIEILFLRAREAHPIPGVLCKSADSEITLYVADGIQGLANILIRPSIFQIIKESLPDLHIEFDLLGRSIELNTCITDAVLYLIAASQCDMQKEVIRLNETLISCQGMDAYNDISNYLTSNNILAPCRLFISPIQTYLHSNVMNLPRIYDTKPTEEMRKLIEEVENSEYVKAHSRPVLFLKREYNGDIKTISLICNTTVWNKSREFEKIVKDIISIIKTNTFMFDKVMQDHYLDEESRLDAVKMLLTDDPKLLYIKDNDGRNLAMHAKLNNREEIANYLLELLDKETERASYNTSTTTTTQISKPATLSEHSVFQTVEEAKKANLIEEITSQIDVYNEDIKNGKKSIWVTQATIEAWENKVAVLTMARSLLAGDADATPSLLKEEEELHTGWDEGKKTKALVEKVKKLTGILLDRNPYRRDRP